MKRIRSEFTSMLTSTVIRNEIKCDVEEWELTKNRENRRNWQN